MNTFIDNNSSPNIWLNSTKNFRRVVGLNGMLLPVFLWLFLYFTTGQIEVLKSISHYYYTRSNTIFIGIMATLSMFLIVYKAEERIDFVVSFIAGVAAICVILFPTDNLLPNACFIQDSHIIAFTQADDFRVNFHYVSAAVFFLALAFMSAFLFTKTHKTRKKTPQKKVRNKIYIICAILMVLSICAILLLGMFKLIPSLPYNKWNLTFWFEVVAVESFGISWLVKGKIIFKD